MSHIVLSNFKRWTLDIFHGVSPGHLQAYLDEYCYRLNRHDQRQDLFRRVLKPLRPLHRPSALFAAHRHLSGGDGHAEDLPLSPCINVTRSMEIPGRSWRRSRRAQTEIPERSVRRPLPP
ncbi:MAG: transposase [Actinobacteria bacterium]|nr:transposase [Actinomycetota bacterium]